jgi:putative ABC transport system permease protein
VAIDLLLETLRSLRAHALRFTLTGMGIVWGTAMLTMLSGYTDGYDRHFQEQIDKVGPRIVWMMPGVKIKERVGERGARQIEFENEDADYVAALYSVEHAAPNLWVGLLIHGHERTTKLLWTFGVTEATGTIRNIEAAEGRFIHDEDVDKAARVVFLGHKAAERLFGRRPAVGRTVHMDSIPFRVIGVGLPKGEQIVNMGPRDDELSLIPVTTAQRRFTRDDAAGAMVFAPLHRDRSAQAIEHVRQVLGLQHDFDPADDRALNFFDIQQAVQLVDALGAGLKIFLTAAGLITLFVGAIGVMNIMLVVVGERTREVGLRKAIGASDRAIFLQFLAEAAVITVVAGALGGVIGWFGVDLVASLVPKDNLMAPAPYLEPSTVVEIALVLIVVGIASGVLPARRAARVDPAISLRSL